VKGHDEEAPVAGPSVGRELSTWMTEAGRAFVRALDDAGTEITAALWLYLPEAETWRLVLGSPEVRTLGPLKLYERFERALKRLPAEYRRLSLDDISVVEPSEQLIQLLSVAIKTGMPDLSTVRFSRNTINGHFIEDALIYRST